MFCYYNTLAWEILAATDAVVIILATLPFVANNQFSNAWHYAAFNYGAAIFLLIVGGLIVRHLRSFATRWIKFDWEREDTSPKEWIDYVEAGDWKPSPSLRTKETNKMLYFVLGLGVAYIIVSALFWSHWFS